MNWTMLIGVGIVAFGIYQYSAGHFGDYVQNNVYENLLLKENEKNIMERWMPENFSNKLPPIIIDKRTGKGYLGSQSAIA